MHILILNGSPKGQYSVTLQTINYLERLHPQHTFEVLHVGQRIKALEKDFAPALAAIEKADLISNPKIKAKMGNAMNEGMLMPYKKVLESVGGSDKK